MELGNRCPFCGGKDCKRNSIMEGDWIGTEGFYLQCLEGFQCTIHPSVWYGEQREVTKRFHQIYLQMKKECSINKNGYKYKYKYYFFYEEDSAGKNRENFQKVNVAELMKNYPKSFMDKMEKAIYNLGKRYPTYGYAICADFEMTHLLYCDGLEYNEYATEVSGILNILCELGYLVHDLSNYRISAKGWEKISEIEKTESNNQGFIAMSFGSETKTISDSFKMAILKSGYIPKRIDEKEHNNQIVPEILFEISRSKFVVVDVTYPNYGAYYEAGYAEALGKEVIICCREDVFNSNQKPHFDIAQKSSIVWKDEEDLENRLYRRIEATVGLNK
jgi:nucleoside 2-deoxyribosyltransferase